jgi:hypothetical protein
MLDALDNIMSSCTNNLSVVVNWNIERSGGNPCGIGALVCGIPFKQIVDGPREYELAQGRRPTRSMDLVFPAGRRSEHHLQKLTI